MNNPQGFEMERKSDRQIRKRSPENQVKCLITMQIGIE